MNEAELIEKFFKPIAGQGALGLSDDAAVLGLPPGCELVLTVDAAIAGVHFFPDDPPETIARKILGVNLSDLAAKAAAPRGFLLTLALSDQDVAWLEKFAQSLGEMAAESQCPLLGGDTVRTPGPLTLSVTAFGAVEAGKMPRRAAARPGDRLFVSGCIGDAALGLELRAAQRGAAVPGWAASLDPAAQDFLIARYLVPRPRLGLIPALRDHAAATMDVSDGLIGDCLAMMRASGAACALDLRRAPLSAPARAALAAAPELIEKICAGGDDYEILAAIAPESADQFLTAAQKSGVAVCEIGVVVEAEQGDSVLGLDGARKNFVKTRYSHF